MACFEFLCRKISYGIGMAVSRIYGRGFQRLPVDTRCIRSRRIAARRGGFIRLRFCISVFFSILPLWIPNRIHIGGLCNDSRGSLTVFRVGHGFSITAILVFVFYLTRAALVHQRIGSRGNGGRNIENRTISRWGIGFTAVAVAATVTAAGFGHGDNRCRVVARGQWTIIVIASRTFFTNVGIINNNVFGHDFFCVKIVDVFPVVGKLDRFLSRLLGTRFG